MTKDEIIALAKEVGFSKAPASPAMLVCSSNNIERFANAIQAAELGTGGGIVTNKIKDNTVAVSTSVFWLPIDEDTPRNVKVLAINRELSGSVCIAEIHTNETWFDHWHPLPKFKYGT